MRTADAGVALGTKGICLLGPLGGLGPPVRGALG
jgi:hypothetical protein